jgi:hypothetical protein
LSTIGAACSWRASLRGFERVRPRGQGPQPAKTIPRAPSLCSRSRAVFTWRYGRWPGRSSRARPVLDAAASVLGPWERAHGHRRGGVHGGLQRGGRPWLQLLAALGWMGTSPGPAPSTSPFGIITGDRSRPGRGRDDALFDSPARGLHQCRHLRSTPPHHPSPSHSAAEAQASPGSFHRPGG